VYLLYLDESGLHPSPYFVLAGLAVFETHTGPLSSEVDHFLNGYLPAPARVEPLRATAVRSGSEPPWDQLSQIKGRLDRMSARRPFGELTRDFTPERRRRVDDMKRELLAEMPLHELRRARALTYQKPLSNPSAVARKTPHPNPLPQERD